MKKTDVVDAMAERSGLTKAQAKAALDAFIDTVTEQLCEGGEVQLIGFGTFRTKQHEARQGRNPATGETMTIAARRSASFKVGKALADNVR